MLFGTNRDEGSTFTGNQSGYGDGQITDQSFYYNWLSSEAQYEQRGHGECEYNCFREGIVNDQVGFSAWAALMFGEDVVPDLVKLYAQPPPLPSPLPPAARRTVRVMKNHGIPCPAVDRRCVPARRQALHLLGDGPRGGRTRRA